MRTALLLAVLAAALGGCARAFPPQVPVSGVTGANGGADQTQYYDRKGRPHFEN